MIGKIILKCQQSKNRYTKNTTCIKRRLNKNMLNYNNSLVIDKVVKNLRGKNYDNYNGHM